MSIRLLSKDIAFYGMLDFLQRSLSILLIPIYTRVLSQASYGNLDLILTVGAALTLLADLQFIAGFTRLYLDHHRSGDGPRFAGSAMITRVLLGSALTLIFLSLGFAGLLEFRFIPSFLGNRAAWTLAALAIPVTFVFDILLAQAQMLRRKKWFFAGALGNTLLLTLLSIAFTAIVPLGIAGVLLGQVLGKAIAASILFVGLRHEVSFHYHKRLVKEVLSYTLPLVPGRWVNHFSAYVSRFFIYGGLGASENAILAIATKLAAVVGLFSVAFRTAWEPLAMSVIGQEGSEHFYARSLRLFMAGGVFSVFFLTALSRPFLAFLAPPSYGAAERYVPLFLLASIVGELDMNLQLGNQIARKTYWMSLASILAVATNVLLLAALVPRIGIYGAGAGLLASFLVKVVITYVSAQRNYKIKYEGRSFWIFATSCALLLSLSLARNGGLVQPVAYFATLALLAFLLPWLTLSVSDRQLFRTVVAEGLARLQGRAAHTS